MDAVEAEAVARAAAAATGPSAEMVAEMQRFLAVEGVDMDRDGGLGADELALHRNMFEMQILRPPPGLG